MVDTPEAIGDVEYAHTACERACAQPCVGELHTTADRAVVRIEPPLRSAAEHRRAENGGSIKAVLDLWRESANHRAQQKLIDWVEPCHLTKAALVLRPLKGVRLARRFSIRNPVRDAVEG